MDNLSENFTGGIQQEKILNKEFIFPELLCGLCHKILLKPKVCSQCETPCCESCLAEWKKLYSTDTQTCLNGCVGQHTQPSKILSNFLNRLKIQCQYKENGCDRDLTYETLQQHESECEYQTMTCAGCKKKMLKKDMNEHQAECDMVLTTCMKCGKSLTKTELKNLHDISDCFGYKTEKIQEAFEKRIIEEKRNIEMNCDIKIALLEEQNKNSQRKIENDLLGKIHTLEEQITRLEMRMGELLQGKEKYLEEAKIVPLRQESKQLKKPNLKASNIFKISFNRKIISQFMKITQQKFTMDSSLDIKDQPKIWHITNFNAWRTIMYYDNIEAVKDNEYKEINLPVPGYGSYWTIFKGCLYFATTSNSEVPKIGKFNLTTNILERNETLDEATGGNTANSWGGYNDVLFISNTQNLYIVYESKETKSIAINLIDADTFTVIKTWKTRSQPKKSYGSIFMINKVLFATQSYNDSSTKVIYKFDTETSKEEAIGIDFVNKGGYDTSLHFCYPVNQLWTVNNGQFYTYDVQII